MKQETYYIDYGAATVYYHVTDDNTVTSSGIAVTMPRHRFLDYLATARELGHKAGKV